MSPTARWESHSLNLCPSLWEPTVSEGVSSLSVSLCQVFLGNFKGTNPLLKIGVVGNPGAIGICKTNLKISLANQTPKEPREL